MYSCPAFGCPYWATRLVISGPRHMLVCPVHLLAILFDSDWFNAFWEDKEQPFAKELDQKLRLSRYQCMSLDGEVALTDWYYFCKSMKYSVFFLCCFLAYLCRCARPLV